MKQCNWPRAHTRSTAIGASAFLPADAKAAARAVVVSSDIPRFFGPIDALLAASPTGFVAHTAGPGTGAGGLSIGDIAIFSLATLLSSGFFDDIPVTCVDPFASVLALVARVGALPEVRALETTYAEPRVGAAAPAVTAADSDAAVRQPAGVAPPASSQAVAGTKRGAAAALEPAE